MKQAKPWLVMIATLLCCLTASAHEFEVDGIYYNRTSEEAKQAEVTYRGGYYNSYSNEYTGAVTIPSTITYDGVQYSVTSIGEDAFRKCWSLTAITIPEGVTSIEYGAFEGCSSLTAITIPEGVTSIGEWAFDGCSSLERATINCANVSSWFSQNTSIKEIVLGDGVTSIGRGAFYNCSGLTAITIPESVTSIGDYAFEGCSSLTSITIPEGVTSIGSWAFEDCSSLTSITIPESVTSIVGDAFYGCSSLERATINCANVGGWFSGFSSIKEIVLGDGVTSIGECAFFDCSSLTSITIPESVTSIGSSAFKSCSSLTTITIPENSQLTSIGYSAFEDCHSLTAITIPEGVTSIEYGAFDGCSSLTAITIPEGVTSIGYSAFYECRSLAAIAIPEGVTSIGDYAFAGCHSLTAITIPEGVTSIGNCAFDHCTALKKVIIEDGSTALSLGYNIYYSSGNGQGLFYYCPLEEVYLGRNLSYSSGSSYGYSPFYSKDELINVIIGNKVTTIDQNAFSGCSNLERATINCANVGSWFSGFSSIKEIVLGDGVTSIGKSAFKSCSSLTSITIPESVTSIGYEAFRGCIGLTAIAIPEGVTSIEDGAFYGCSSLKLVINYSDLALQRGRNDYGYVGYYADNVINLDEFIGDYAFKTKDGVHYLTGYIGYDTELTLPTNYQGGIYQIEDGAFYGCSSLTSINIPEGVTSIGGSAFRNCNSLTAITIPEGVTSIGGSAFYGCSSLTAIAIPEGVTSIGGSAFYGCSSLTAIAIPEGVTSIEYGAFFGCSSLTSITIPESVTSIGKSAFKSCSSLTSITIPESVTSIGYEAFRGCIGLTAIAIPEGVTSIEYGAFFGCSSLTSITIPESVTSIGDCAFEGCSSLKLVINYSDLALQRGRNDYGYVGYYADNVINLDEFIGDYAFKTKDGVHYLTGYIGYDTELTLPTNYQGGIYQIEDGAFHGCSSLTSINIPEGVTSIGGSAFDNCTTLKKVIIEDGSTALSLGYNIYYSSDTGEGLFYDCPLEEVYLGRNLSYSSGRSYGYSPFYSKDELVNVIIGNKVTTIDQYAFYDCYNIHSLTIPSGVLSIGNSAFSTPEKVIWLTNTPPTGYANAQGDINYAANEQHSSLSNMKVYPYLSSMFEVGGVKYVPVSPSERTCHAIDCAYDESVATINVSETVSFKGVAMKVTEVMPYTFYGNNQIKEAAVSHLGDIGDYAFYDCDSIKTVNVSNQGNIGSQAFFNCDGIESIKVSNQGDIGEQAFYDCNSIKTIEVNNQGNIGRQAFYGCDGMESVVVSNQGDIGYQAFYNCDGIESVKASNQGDIGEQAFYDCNSIKTIEVNNQGDIGRQAFYGCDGMESVVVSNQGDIAYQAFCNCDGIESVKASNQGDIGEQAFYDCNSIKTIEVNNRGNIGRQAFYGCNGMETAIVANLAPISSSKNDAPLTFADWTSTNKADGSTSSNTYTFTAKNETVLSFDWWVSSESIYDKLIVTLDGATILEKSGNLSATYSNAVSQGEHTLIVKYTKDSSQSSGSDQASVSNITVGEGGAVTFVAGVGNEAFSGCSALKTVILGDSIGSLGDKTFYQCTNLQEIVIPDSVKFVGEYCFSSCSGMKSATIGGGVGNIAAYTFENCTALEEVVVGGGVTTISNNAFTGCSALTNVELGNSVATINNYAFQNCSSLPEISIPQSTTTIGDYAFSGCAQLADVIIEDRTTALSLGSNGSSALFADCPLDSVYIGGKITYSTTSSKGYSPFYRNTSLRTVVITDREEQIYNNEFYGCTNLQNVTIGNGVKSIGNYAFSGCSSLEGFSFGSNMESIGDEAFSDCTSLTSITSHACVPPTCGTQALDDINKWECVLGVPLGNADAYYAADQWKEFFFIEDVVEVDHYVLTYVVDGEIVHTEVLKHKDAVAMLAEPAKVGYEFSGWDKTLTVMPAEDVVISGTFTRLPVDNFVILDTEENFLIDEEMEYETVTYTRHFENTEWQALYVPFDIPVTEEFLDDFEVADLNNVHQYDYDNDNIIDETVIEAFKMTSGTLEANYPYLIRAKETGEKSIIVTDATLYAAEENSIDCSSVREKFTFTGTYSILSSAGLPQGEGYYTLIDGEWQPVTEAVALGAFRFYLKVDSRSGALAAEARSIRMRIIGENGEDDTTGIDNLESPDNDGRTTVIYDLQGRKVLNAETLQEGVYIINGKKVVIK